MNLIVIKSSLLSKIPGLIHGISTKISVNESNFNLSNSFDKVDKTIELNRKLFFDSLGIPKDRTVFQKQVHSDKFYYATEPGIIDSNDALITNKPNLFLVVTIADCIPILFYDVENKIAGVVHAGWRGTTSAILKKTVTYAIEELKMNIQKTYFYFGPSICQKCFEVDEDVAKYFELKYIGIKEKKFLIDLLAVNRDYLLSLGARKEYIQISKLCTYEASNLLHSYRRDKENSGRMFGVIGFK